MSAHIEIHVDTSQRSLIHKLSRCRWDIRSEIVYITQCNQGKDASLLIEQYDSALACNMPVVRITCYLDEQDTHACRKRALDCFGVVNDLFEGEGIDMLIAHDRFDVVVKAGGNRGYADYQMHQAYLEEIKEMQVAP